MKKGKTKQRERGDPEGPAEVWPYFLQAFSYPHCLHFFSRPDCLHIFSIRHDWHVRSIWDCGIIIRATRTAAAGRGAPGRQLRNVSWGVVANSDLCHLFACLMLARSYGRRKPDRATGGSQQATCDTNQATSAGIEEATNGISTSKLLPFPTVLVTPMWPWCSSTMRRTSERPRPVPLLRVV